jgi:hypothetical protein
MSSRCKNSICFSCISHASKLPTTSHFPILQPLQYYTSFISHSVAVYVILPFLRCVPLGPIFLRIFCSQKLKFYSYELGQISPYSDRLQDGRQGFDSRQGQEIFLYSTASRPALGPTQPPIQWVPGELSPGVKRLRREGDHSPPSSVQIKNGGAIPPLPHTSSWCSS